MYLFFRIFEIFFGVGIKLLAGKISKEILSITSQTLTIAAASSALYKTWIDDQGDKDKKDDNKDNDTKDSKDNKDQTESNTPNDNKSDTEYNK